MILRLSIILLSSGILFAQDSAPDAKINPIALLPDGSVLKEVLLPRYNSERHLVGDLKAETMTLIDSNRIQGENILIQFYDKNQSPSGKVKLLNALFDQSTSLLYATEAVEITNDNLVARGSGLVYAFQKGRGFLRGPATTWISPTPKPPTSMLTSPIGKAAIFALCLAPPLSLATPPILISTEGITGIKAEAESQEPDLGQANGATQTQLDADMAADMEAAEKVSEAAIGFVKNSKITTTITDEVDETIKTTPLEVNPGPNDTVIKCDGGMYFDADAGVLVYMKNVTVTDPRFNLSGASELKVFFEKKAVETKEPAKDAKEPVQDAQKPKMSGPTASFGDVQKLIATGAVLFLQKSVGGKEPVEASGAILTYDVPKGEIIISRGFPWVKQGSFYARAKQANLTLRLLNNGSFSTQGSWEMGGSLNLKKK